MIEFYKIDYTLRKSKEDLDEQRIYNIIASHVENYKMIYKKPPHIYVSKECINFLLFSNRFSAKSHILSMPYIGLLCGCYTYIINELDNGDFYLSPNKPNKIDIANFKKIKRKLKIEQLNNL